MRWVPLLAAVLSFSAPLTAAAGPCVVPTRSDDPATAWYSFDDSTVECRVAASHLADVAKLRAAAGFDESTLKYYIVQEDSVNAYYQKGAIHMLSGYLKSDFTREARLATLAHEIGHAVQDKQGKFDWAEEPFQAFLKRVAGQDPRPKFEGTPEWKEGQARSRRMEAQADLIGQELLVRAGYDADTFTRGRANRWGCLGLSDLYLRGEDTHPRSAQRWVNAAIGRGTVVGRNGNEAAQKLAAEISAGSTLPEFEQPPAGAYAPRPYTPSVSLEDFNEVGRLKPGRQLAARLSLAPPPPDAGFVRTHATYIAGSVVDFYVAAPLRGAVDRIAEGRSVAVQTLKACGTPQAERFEEDWGTAGWIGRVARDWAANLVAPKTPDPEKFTVGAVPG